MLKITDKKISLFHTGHGRKLKKTTKLLDNLRNIGETRMVRRVKTLKVRCRLQRTVTNFEFVITAVWGEIILVVLCKKHGSGKKK